MVEYFALKARAKINKKSNFACRIVAVGLSPTPDIIGTSMKDPYPQGWDNPSPGVGHTHPISEERKTLDTTKTIN